MRNAATAMTGWSKEECSKLSIAPPVMKENVYLQEAAIT